MVMMKIANEDGEDNTNVTVNCTKIYIILNIYETTLNFPIYTRWSQKAVEVNESLREHNGYYTIGIPLY